MTIATRQARYLHSVEGHSKSNTGESPIKISKLGHLVYEVSDIDRSVEFWTKVMGFRVVDRLPNGMTFLNYGEDHHGIALRPVGKKNRPVKGNNLDFEHLAFEVESIDVLVRARDYLKANDIPIIFEGRKGPGCNISVNFLDPDGFEFELYYGIDKIGEDGTARPPSQYIRSDTLEDAIANPLPDKW